MQIFRVRRGKVVPVPDNWKGNFTTHKTIADRKIKAKCKKLDRRRRLLKERNEHLSSYVFDIEADVL